MLTQTRSFIQERKWLNATTNARLEVCLPRPIYRCLTPQFLFSLTSSSVLCYTRTRRTRTQVIPDAGYMCVIDKRHRDKVRDLILQFAGYAFSLSTWPLSLLQLHN
jgi:hypothetical protein